MKKRILVMVGGGTKHIQPFVSEGEKLGLDVVIGSFSQLEYTTSEGKFRLELRGVGDVADFDCIYLRLVGKRYEDASLICSYARDNGVMLVDKMYDNSKYTRIPLAKSLETKLLSEAGIPFPKTLFTRLDLLGLEAPKVFGYPFVIKGTFGKQGHAVWAPRDEKELNELLPKLKERELKKGERFLAQEFAYAGQRNRIFVVGNKAVAGITRPTRWRSRFLDKVDGVTPKGIRETLNPIPKIDAELAVKAAKAVGVDVGGVDVVHEEKTGRTFIFEVNSAPGWKSLKRDTGINIEREILEYISSIINK